jgi:hypothetical protein
VDTLELGWLCSFSLLGRPIILKICGYLNKLHSAVCDQLVRTPPVLSSPLLNANPLFLIVTLLAVLIDNNAFYLSFL